MGVDTATSNETNSLVWISKNLKLIGDLFAYFSNELTQFFKNDINKIFVKLGPNLKKKQNNRNKKKHLVRKGLIFS